MSRMIMKLSCMAIFSTVYHSLYCLHWILIDEYFSYTFHARMRCSTYTIYSASRLLKCCFIAGFNAWLLLHVQPLSLWTNPQYHHPTTAKEELKVLGGGETLACAAVLKLMTQACTDLDKYSCCRAMEDLTLNACRTDCVRCYIAILYLHYNSAVQVLSFNMHSYTYSYKLAIVAIELDHTNTIICNHFH